MIGDDRENVRLSPDQAIKLMSVAQLLAAGDIDIRGYEIEEVEAAKAAITDAAQEIALQVHRGD